MNQDHIRNFAIIAHIDHGKSTLADRLLEMTSTIDPRIAHAEQILDSNPIERERGITIKLAPVRMKYQSKQIQNSNNYILNLIDTPGHVDFGYEVSRSLAACEGALLVVDATQGVQAQTLANLHQARLHNLTIIPLINKIDLPNAQVEKTIEELVDLGFDPNDCLPISAKTGEGVDLVLERIVERIKPPSGIVESPLRALVFSSIYDKHKGVVVFIRIVDGSIDFNHGILPNDDHSIQFMASKTKVVPLEIGYFTPTMKSSGELFTGEVGYIATGLKDIKMAKVGDTITLVQSSKFKVQSSNQILNYKQYKINNEQNSKLVNPTIQQSNHPTIHPLPGYKEPKSMVFLRLFPIDTAEYTKAREAMEKLRLSDSAFTFKTISSSALGNGFHCGFLGLLHAEVVQERLSREFDLAMLATAPSVEYRITLKQGVRPEKLGILIDSTRVISMTDSGDGKFRYFIQSATEFPDASFLESIEEPMMKVIVYAPKAYVGAIMQICEGKRGEYVNMKYLHAVSSGTSESGISNLEASNRAMVEFEYLIPLSEMIVDFFDKLKSVTEGYASLDYEFFDFQSVDAVKVDIVVNFEKVDALSFFAVRDSSESIGRTIVERLAKVIPRQQFNIPVQAAIGGRIIARSDVKPFRKDVIQKLYGGDRTRKDKLLDKQKKGKKKMKRIGAVEIPQTAFFEVLKRE
jgi:GTP-binding protein LepA